MLIGIYLKEDVSIRVMCFQMSIILRLKRSLSKDLTDQYLILKYFSVRFP